jgi:hypothetical protein
VKIPLLELRYEVNTLYGYNSFKNSAVLWWQQWFT